MLSGAGGHLHRGTVHDVGGAGGAGGHLHRGTVHDLGGLGRLGGEVPLNFSQPTGVHELSPDTLAVPCEFDSQVIKSPVIRCFLQASALFGLPVLSDHRKSGHGVGLTSPGHALTSRCLDLVVRHRESLPWHCPAPSHAKWTR